jgi:predicted Fe-Mo cluster-binding NifX family protein
MKLALSTWNDLVAPVFDVSGTVMVVKISSGRIKARKREDISGMDNLARINLLCSLKIEVLVCGAISKPWHDILTAWDIQVISYVSGKAEEVLRSLLKNNVNPHKLYMPGCPESIQDQNLEAIVNINKFNQKKNIRLFKKRLRQMA